VPVLSGPFSAIEFAFFLSHGKPICTTAQHGPVSHALPPFGGRRLRPKSSDLFLALSVPVSMGMVQHTARRIDYLVGAAQVLARSEYVRSVSAERSQRGPRRDRNRRRLRDDQRTARIENWRRWDIWHRRDLRGRNSDRQRNSCKRKTAK